MKLDNTTFHVVQTPESDHIVQTETEAIELLQNGAVEIDGESDDISVMKVDYDREDWTIQSLPWQRIAIKLLSDQ